jgi:predicted MFS family arabinose efflux permease
MLVSWLPIALVRHSLLALVTGLIVLDLAVQAVHVTSQSRIYQIDPAARSRLVGAYMVFYSIGSAGGAIASTAIYAVAGWTGVCLLGAAISGTALALWAIAERRGAEDGVAGIPDRHSRHRLGGRAIGAAHDAGTRGDPSRGSVRTVWR